MGAKDGYKQQFGVSTIWSNVTGTQKGHPVRTTIVIDAYHLPNNTRLHASRPLSTIDSCVVSLNHCDVQQFT